MAPPDVVDRTAELVSRNQKLLIRARETHDWTRAALKRAEHGVRQAMQTRIAHELSAAVTRSFSHRFGSPMSGFGRWSG
jgi:hypothetical protein